MFVGLLAGFGSWLRPQVLWQLRFRVCWHWEAQHGLCGAYGGKLMGTVGVPALERLPCTLRLSCFLLIILSEGKQRALPLHSL